MENAADALHMAASVLIFVLALTISINAFGQVRQTSQALVEYNDREYSYTYVEENTDEAGNVLTERLVGLDSIIPSIYKAYRENYKIVFRDSETSETAENLLGNDGLYRKRNNETGNYDPVYKIDLEKESLAGDEQKLEFLSAILYGDDADNFGDISSRLGNLGISLNSKGLYDKINNIKLKEDIGIYYQEEAGTVDDDSDIETSGSDVPEANKTEKRVITYTMNY